VGVMGKPSIVTDDSVVSKFCIALGKDDDDAAMRLFRGESLNETQG
jgi:hypothetical protein